MGERDRCDVVVAAPGSQKVVGPGCLLNQFAEPMRAVQDCVVIDVDKKELKKLCMLLRWKYFGVGATNCALFARLPRRWSSDEADRLPGLRGPAGVRERSRRHQADGVSEESSLRRSAARVVLTAVDSMAQAVQSGKALYVGLSNYDGETMRRAADILEQLHCPYIINQNRYSILDRETERNGILDASADRKKGVIIYSPLAQGMLTDRYLHGIPEDSRIRTDGRFLQASQLTEERLAQLRQLQAIAQDRGQTLAQLALCWILRQKAVTSVLVGASRPEQITDTLQIVGQKPLTDEELRAVDAAVGL